jgi:hypothetical protein
VIFDATICKGFGNARKCLSLLRYLTSAQISQWQTTFAGWTKQSIVNTSIIAAVTGGYGDIHATKRTEGSTLFINPLMALYWGFHLESVVRRNLYLGKIRDTDTAEQVALEIEKFRDSLPRIRPATSIPC